MANQLLPDDGLIEEARRIGRHRTQKAAITAALEEYIRQRKQLRIVELFGTIEYHPQYDYKAERNRTRR